jgi:hypothetical protein
MQESGSDELSLFNPKGIYPFLFGRLETPSIARGCKVIDKISPI